MFSKLRSGLTYANVMATIAVFVALGGGAYAALKLPQNSVGSKQIKKNAVNSAKVKNRSRLAKDFKAGEVPAGPAGEARPSGAGGRAGGEGRQGDACLSTDPACRGPKGDSATLSFDGQFDRDGNAHEITTVQGMRVSITCFNGNDLITIGVQRLSTSDEMYGGGTQWDGTALGRAEVTTGPLGSVAMAVTGSTTADLDVAVKASPVLTEGKYTRLDAAAVRGSKCNYHVLIIPPA